MRHIDAFDRLFDKFRESTIILSYSSNGFPDIDTLKTLMGRYKGDIHIFEKPHRYHFGTHSAVARAQVEEYLIVGI